MKAVLKGGGRRGVCLIIDSTTISNLFYNVQSAPKSTIYRQKAKIYNFCSKAKSAVYKSTRFRPEKNAVKYLLSDLSLFKK